MAKGSGFERETCKRLSLWWSGGTRSDIFWRTSNSGGRATVRNASGLTTRNQHGDVCATDPIGQPFIDAFLVELKRGYNRNTIYDVLDKSDHAKVQTVEGWIAKAIDSAAVAGSKSWMVVHRRDQRQSFVLMPYRDFQQHAEVSFREVVPLIRCHVEVRGMRRTTWIGQIAGLLLEDWFKAFPPDAIKEWVKSS